MRISPKIGTFRNVRLRLLKLGVVSEFIRELQSYEEYSFSLDELREKTNAPESSMRKELNRLGKDKQILNLRKSFYLILPPRFQHYGKLPVALYIDKLFKFLQKPYYVGYYSAASYHGAAHQQIQQDYVITAPPALRGISKENVQIRFFSNTVWPKKNIVKRKSDTGYFNISSPALTFADLIENQQYLGGLSRMMTILEELTESLEENDIKDLLSWYSNKSVLQRMGFLIEEMSSNENIQSLLFESLNAASFFPVLLSPDKGQKAGATGNRWKVDVNQIIESDL